MPSFWHCIVCDSCRCDNVRMRLLASCSSLTCTEELVAATMLNKAVTHFNPDILASRGRTLKTIKQLYLLEGCDIFLTTGVRRQQKKNQAETSSGNVSSSSLWADVIAPCLCAVLRLRLLWWPAGSVCLSFRSLSVSPAGSLLPGFSMLLQSVPYLFAWAAPGYAH